MDRLLDIAPQAGLYVIARPGPYINAETDRRRFPGWLTTQAGKARTTRPTTSPPPTSGCTAIDAILARPPVTNGTGSVILYQIENELAATGTAQQNYMQHLTTRCARTASPCRSSTTTRAATASGCRRARACRARSPGPIDLYAFDGYPGGTCHTDAHAGHAPTPRRTGASRARAAPPAVPARRRARPGSSPSSAAAGSTTGAATAPTRAPPQREGPGYERVFYEHQHRQPAHACRTST